MGSARSKKVELGRINQRIRYLRDFVMRHGQTMDGRKAESKETEREIIGLMLRRKILKK